MTKKLWIVYGGVFVVLFLLFMNVALMRHYFKGQTEEWKDTVRVTVVDTVTYDKPVARDSVLVRYVTRKLPVKHDTVHSICTDSADIEIPITQKQYSDSIYTAWVSGYEPSLDSIRVYSRKEVITINKTIKEPPNRFVVSLNIGYVLHHNMVYSLM